MERVMKTVMKKLSVFLVATCSLSLTSVAFAAVQMDGHMDFVLDNGRTIRVYPEAKAQGPIRPGNILPKRQKVNTKPPGGDPCERVDKMHKSRLGIEEKKKEKAKQNKPYKPNWVKQARKLKRARFLGRLYKNYKPTSWYYLPAEPRIAMKDNIPEATFLKFITDETTEAGGAEGGLFHVMVTYGLTQAEQNELQAALKEAVPGAKLKGMVDLVPSKSGDNFIVTSGTMSDGQFAPTGVLSSGRAPSFPGAKAALAGRLSSLGAQLMEASFENTTSDLSVTFNYDYIVKTPAFTGEIRIDMDRIQDVKDCALQTRDKTVDSETTYDPVTGAIGAVFLGPVGALFGFGEDETVTVSRQDLAQGYETLVSLGAVEINFDQNVPEAEIENIQGKMMDMAMDSFLKMQESFATNEQLNARREANASDAETKAAESRERDQSNSDHYTYYKVKQKQTRQTGVLTFKITQGLALYRTHSMTGNIGGFIRDYKDKVYDEVVLNDPFFKRGEIVAEMGNAALDLFESRMINNVAVKVIVPFKDNPYENDDVFTRTDINSGNILKKFTFAKRGDNMVSATCPYKYIESWSFTGGGTWPKNPKSKCAKTMLIPLSPPIESRDLQVEANLPEMEELGIRGVDVKFKYKQFGKNKTSTSKFRVAKGEAYNEEQLFVDKNANNVEYQIILTHTDRGVFSTDWLPLEADFVYANLSGLPLSTLEKIREKLPEAQEVKDIIDEIKDIF